MKRCLDVILAAAALVVLFPVLLLIAVAIKASSTGPVIFKQPRIGKNASTFMFYKFRTMRIKTEWPLGRQEFQSVGSDGELVKQRNDARVTSFGRFLRKFSLDELPQLFNVLIGNMSLIGPRPLIPEMSYAFPEFHKARHLVKPGISGLWQLRNRANSTSAASMQADDLEYIEQLSLLLDCKIILKTLPLLLGDKNAF